MDKMWLKKWEKAYNDQKEKEKEEWVWVDGYKGTHKDLTCMNNFQYNIGTQYDMPEDSTIGESHGITMCNNGFHLCLNLVDVFRYYTPGEGRRYFECRALVRKRDVDRYGMQRPFDLFANNKLVAKSIVLTKEVDKEELFEAVRNTYIWLQQAPDEFVAICLETSEEKASFEFYKKTLIDDGYSEAFATYLSSLGSEKYECAHALAGENISMDIKVLSILMPKGD